MEQYTHIPYPDPNYPGIFLKQAPSTKSFSHYLFVENKIYSLLMIFLMFCEFIVFKFFYPYPDFFSDSYSYIYAAYAHLDVNIWPIGYSKFLYAFHNITHSATALTFFQYLFLELAALYFYHTIVYLFRTGNKTRTILCLFLFFNPLFLYLSNYVSSDALFTGFSLIWFTQLIWILRRPKLYHMIIQAVCMFIAFTFRYNAFYYPIIAGLTFYLSSQKIWIKLLGIISGPLLVISFVIYSSNATKHMTGTSQFPPILAGWQLANNALYAYEYADIDSVEFKTKETRELNRIAKTFFEKVPKKERQLSFYVANYFIREWSGPLKLYMLYHYPKFMQLSNTEQVIIWGKVSPVFHDFGLTIIKNHPFVYTNTFILLNIKNYFLPPLEKLEVYNLGTTEIWPIAQYWFQFQSPKITAFSKTLQGIILFLFPSLYFILNLYFTIFFFQFITVETHKNTRDRGIIIFYISALFLLSNAIFSVLANVIVLRYQIYPMIIFLTCSLLLSDHLDLTKIEIIRQKKSR